MEAETVVILITMVGSILGSTLTTIHMLLNRMDRLEDKFEQRFGSVDGEFKTVHGEFKTVHGEFKQVRQEIAGVGERLARVEDHLIGPESFSPRPLPPPPAEPDDGERQTG